MFTILFTTLDVSSPGFASMCFVCFLDKSVECDNLTHCVFLHNFYKASSFDFDHGTCGCAEYLWWGASSSPSSVARWSRRRSLRTTSIQYIGLVGRHINSHLLHVLSKDVFVIHLGFRLVGLLVLAW